MAESTRQINVTPEEIDSGKTMAIIAYFIFFVPLLVEDAKKNKFAMFHTEQSIVLFIIQVIVIIVGTITCGIGYILYIPLLVFYVMGIVYAAQGQVKEIPLVGKFGEKFNLVK
jgi:uncharacterized membrane protein